MKCTNCDFECDSKYCPMCGSKTVEYEPMQEDNPLSSANPYGQPTSQNYGNNSVPQQPPYGAQTTPQGSPNHNYGNMSYSQGFPSMQPPVNPVENTKKSNKKISSKVIMSIIALVIVAGIVINVVSVFSGQKSIIQSLYDQVSSDHPYDSYYDSYFYGSDGTNYDYSFSDTYDEDYLDNSYYDYDIHPIGEKASIPEGSITLKSVEPADIKSDEYKNLSFYNATFEVKNDTDKTAYYTKPEVLATPYKNWVDMGDVTCESTSDDIQLDSDDYFAVKSGKTQTFTVLYSFDKKPYKINFDFTLQHLYSLQNPSQTGIYSLIFSATLEDE